MASDFRTYIIECCKQAPLSWRKGAVIMTALLSLGLFAALFLGWHFDAYPTWIFLTGAGVIAAIDVLTIFPYQLWKANLVEIAGLKGQIAANATLGEITDLYEEMVRLLNEMETDYQCRRGTEHWKAAYQALETKIKAKIEAFAGRPEAGIYTPRGLIKRQLGEGLPSHQMQIDLARHDIVHLRDFIRDYSREKLKG